MKRNTIPLILSVLMVMFFMGCKKATPAYVPEVNVIDQPTDLTDVQWGIGKVTGQVMPLMKYTLMLLSEGNKTDFTYTVGEDGTFIFPKVRAGAYILMVIPAAPSFNVTNRKLCVIPEETTELGVIYVSK